MSPFTIFVKSDQFSTLNARIIGATELLDVHIKGYCKHRLQCQEITTLPEEYTSEFILDRNHKSQKRVVFHVYYLAFNPVCLSSQLRTSLHSVAYLWFHIVMLLLAKVMLFFGMTKFYIGFLLFNLSKALAESEDWTIDLRAWI